MTRRRAVLVALGVTALVLVAGRWTAALYTDYLWFQSLGATDVWRTRLIATATLEGGAFLIASAFAFVNVWAVRQSVVSLVLPRRLANIEIGEEVPSSYLFLAVLALSALVGLAMLPDTDSWPDLLLAFGGQPFGESDLYFGADLGFFVYWLPFETSLHLWSVLLLVLVSGLVVLLYALTPSLSWERGRLQVSAYVRRHFTMLGGVLLLVLAWSYRLAMYRLTIAGSGPAGLFTWIDHRVAVPALLLLAVITMCAALVVTWAGWTGQVRLAFLAVSTVLALTVVARGIAPLLARRAKDPAEAAALELRYQGTRHSYTRRAYGVERIRPETIGTGFPSAIAAARRVGVWDGSTLAHAAQRARRVRVIGPGIAWQSSDTSLYALLVERSSESGDARDSWGIRRFDPTASDERGVPGRELLGSTDELVLPEPAVYDSAANYSVLSDSLRRIAGVEMVSTRSRLAHAWSLQNFRLLFGELPVDRPTMVRHRDVRDRVHELAPFFEQGSEVLPLVARDTLYWVLELYSTADEYPLAERFTVLGEERSYFQHAATALVHAASGRVLLLPVSTPDPVATSWMVRFPGLFTTPSALSPAVRDALPPVRDGARAQALALARAGFRGDSLELRHFAVPDGADSAAGREPLHVQLPQLGVSSLWPLLDEQQRVRGVIAATGGATRGTSWIPLASDDLRWGAVLDRLRSSDTTSRERGIVHAPVRVIPVAGRPFYLQSAFQWRPGSSPTLVHVGTLVADTLRGARGLAAALGAPPAARAGAQSAPSSDLRQRAESLYQVMRDALARGDWAAFGRAFDALGSALRPATP